MRHSSESCSLPPLSFMTPDSVSCKIRVWCQKTFGQWLKKILNNAVIHIQTSAPNNIAMLCS